MHRDRIVAGFLLTFLGSAFLAGMALAQTTSGSFRGTITDKSGAVVAGATVRITDTAKGIMHVTQSDARGYYEFLSVPPGSYNFAVSLAGFQSLENRNVVLLVNQSATLDFTLRPGIVTQQIAVTAQAPLINTTNSTVGSVVEHTQVVQLPLNGRQFTQLILLTPGAAPQNSSQQPSFEVATHYGAISPAVNGVRPDSNNFTIDGVENNELFFNFVAVSPPPDALQEFKVQTDMSSGAYGRAPGANVSIVTRSGGNQFHGDAWEFLRNDIFDSRNFFGAKRPAFRQNQFGATLGGPIRKDKVWAFGWYEGFRSSLGSTLLAVVPTAAEMNGDFSGVSHQLFNPFTTAQAGTNSSGQPIFVRTPFANNQIPTSLFNPAALALAQHYLPLPNLPAGPGQPNFINTEPITTNYNQFSARVDAALSQKSSMFARFTETPKATFSSPAATPHAPAQTINMNAQAVVGLTHTFSPNTVLNFHAQYLRTFVNILQGNCLPLSQMVSTGLYENFPPQKGFSPCSPSVSIAGYSGVPGVENVPQGPINSWEYEGDLTKVIGRHTLGFGGALIRMWGHFDNQYATASFDQLATSDPQNTATTGDGLASYLLGVPSAATREDGDGGQSLYGNYYSGYVNDEWRATPKLTVTVGVRYDYSSPFQDTRGRIAAPDWITSTPTNIVWLVDQTSTVPAPSSPGVTVQRVRPGLYSPARRDWAPRLSLAYRLGSKTSVHAGYGIFYEFNQSNFQTQDSIMGNWPFGDPVNTTSGLNQPVIGSPLPSQTLGVSLFAGTPPYPSPVPPLGSGVFAVDPHRLTPYVEEWNAGVDHSFANNWGLSVTYLGNEGTHLNTVFRTNTSTTPGPGAIPRRLPQLGTVIYDIQQLNSNYNAAEVKLEKKYSQGLTWLTSYTYSRCMDYAEQRPSSYGNSDFQNPWDRRPEYAPCAYDLTHVFVTSAIYDLPFGAGKRYLNQPGWVARKLISGWQTSGILTMNNGFPFTIYVPFDNANIGVTGQRPNLVGALLPSGFQQTPNHWFNTSALSVTPYTFGDLGRNDIRQDGYHNFDFSLSKQTKVTERLGIEFRGDFFNIFNHPNFAAPDSGFNHATFGQILAMNGSPRDIQFALKLIF